MAHTNKERSIELSQSNRPPMEAARSFIASDGTKIAYRLWRGNDTKRPLIVLIHGIASNLTRWSEFVEHTSLINDWDILRLDLRGHGESMWRGKLNLEIWSQDLLGILEAESYSRAVLIGHSLGAQIAVHFANRHSPRVDGLVLMDPVFAEALKGSMRWVRYLRPVIALLIGLIMLLNRLGVYRRHLPSRDLRALDETVRKTLLESGQYEAMIERYSSPWPDLKVFPVASYIQEAMQMVRSLPALSSITIPVLILLSRGQTYTDPDRSREVIVRIPDVRLVLIDAYHWPLTERPVEVREAIESWCAALGQAKTTSLRAGSN
jgi:pimeloyl-ACP methyl ester carboxylesterase